MLTRWQRDLLEYADQTLKAPPKWEWTKRVVGRGTLVQRFVLPLGLCLTSNVRMHASRAGSKWKLGKLKEEVSNAMLLQVDYKRARVPLPGRPMVLAIRFSSQPTDVNSDWSKVPVDRLTAKNGGLGYLVDDSPRHCDLNVWCEYAPGGNGFCLIEVWSGEATKKRRRKS